MDKKKDFPQIIEREAAKLKWIANVDKDDESVRVKGHIIGPPKAADQYSAEELEEMGVVGIYAKVPKDKKKLHRK